MQVLKERINNTQQRIERTQQQMLAKQQEMRELHAEITKTLEGIERDKESDKNKKCYRV